MLESEKDNVRYFGLYNSQQNDELRTGFSVEVDSMDVFKKCVVNWGEWVVDMSQGGEVPIVQEYIEEDYNRAIEVLETSDYRVMEIDQQSYDKTLSLERDSIPFDEVTNDKEKIFVGTGEVYLFDDLDLDVEADYYPEEYFNEEAIRWLEALIKERELEPVKSVNGYIDSPENDETVVYLADEENIDYAVAFKKEIIGFAPKKINLDSFNFNAVDQQKFFWHKAMDKENKTSTLKRRSNDYER